MKHDRTKATSIPPEVREAVEKRDGGLCIFCHRPGRGEGHVISRAHGGLGVERNIITICRPCHHFMDNGLSTEFYKAKAIEYLKSKYPDWNEEDLIHNKWKDLKFNK